MTTLRILTVFACAAVFQIAATLFIPITLGFFLFLLLDPVVRWLKSKGVSRTLSSLTLVFLSVIVSGLITWGFYGAFAEIAGEVPAYSHKLKSLLAQASQKAAMLQHDAHSAVPSLKSDDDVQKVELVQGYSSWTTFAMKGLGTAFEALSIAFFIPLIGLFLLLSRDSLGLTLQKILPAQFNSRQALREMTSMMISFCVGNLMIGGAMAICLSVLFFSLGLHNAIPLGIATGFINLIPLAGPFFSLAFPVLQGLLQFDSAGPFIIIATSVVFLHFLVSNVIVPKVVGSHVNVNVLAATIGLLFWGWAWGAIGLLLAVPLVGLLKITLENHAEWKDFSRIFSEHAAEALNQPALAKSQD